MPEPLGPERHDLHETHRPGIGHRPAVEAAFDVNDREDQPGGRGSAPVRWVSQYNRGQDVQAVRIILDPVAQPRLHQLVPDGGVEPVGEALGLGNGGGNHGSQAGVELLVGPGRQGQDDQQGRQQAPQQRR